MPPELIEVIEQSLEREQKQAEISQALGTTLIMTVGCVEALLQVPGIVDHIPTETLAQVVDTMRKARTILGRIER